MASVKGSRIVKREPWPGVLSICSAPPSFLTSTAPGLLRQRTRRREARLEHQLHDVFIRKLLVGTNQAEFQTLIAYCAQVHARAVVIDLDDDLGAFTPQFQMNMPTLILARRAAHFW